MKNKHYVLRPANVDVNGIVAGGYDTTAKGFMVLDGALCLSRHRNLDTGVTAQSFKSADGLARQIEFDQQSGGSADLSDARFEIKGTDCNGNLQTDSAIVGPSNGTPVQSTKFFLEVFSIECTTLDVTAGTIDVGTNGLMRSPWILMPCVVEAPQISWDVTGRTSFDLHHTHEDVLNCFKPAGTPGAFEANGQVIRADEDALIVTADTTIAADTADVIAKVTGWPYTALRVELNSYTDGLILTLNITFTSLTDAYA